MSDFKDLHFSIDEPAECQEFACGELVVRGWAIASKSAPLVRARLAGNSWMAVPNGKPRPDVAKAFPNNPEAPHSGFLKRIDLQNIPPGECELVVELSSGENGAQEIRRKIKILDMSKLSREAFACPQGDYLRIKLEEPSEDSLILQGSALRVGGWTVARTGVKKVEIWIDGEGPHNAHHSLMREDVGTRYEDFPGASHAGFLWASQIGNLNSGEHLVRVVCSSQGGSRLELTSTFRVDSRSEYEIWSSLNRFETEQLVDMLDNTAGLSYAPKITIVTPVYKSPEDLLEKCVKSVRQQAFPNWELILVDDGSKEERLTALLDAFAEQDQRIKTTTLPANAGIARATNVGLSLASGDYIGFLDHDDEISPDALLRIVETLNHDRSLDVLYSDEDKIDESGKHKDVFFKPDWSPELLLSMNYVCHFLVCRRSLLEEVGGLRPGFEGSQDYDLILRLSERTSKIHRVPKVLYHWRTHEHSTATSMQAKPMASDAGRRAIQEHLYRRGVNAEVEEIGPGRYRPHYEIVGAPEIAIIIPTGGSPTLPLALKSIIQTTTYQNYRIVVVDNSKNEGVSDTVRAFSQHFPRISLVDCRGLAFNFSLLCNRAAGDSDAPYLLFLNDDTSIITPDWIQAMLEQSAISDVGAVGALLLFPNGTIQHAGVVCGLFEIAGHPFRGLPERPYYFDFTHVVRNCSAVTGACLLIRRSDFEQLGGFDEENLPTCFQDVDLCLRILEKGSRVVYTPFAKLFHHESFSKKTVAESPELKYMERRWSSYLSEDPYYNPNLSRTSDDYGLRYDALFLSADGLSAGDRPRTSLRLPKFQTPAAKKLQRFGPVDFYLVACAAAGSESGKRRPDICWRAPGATKVQVRVGSPMGRLFAEGGAAGGATTGSWLRSGTVFYLLDASDDSVAFPEKVLSVLQVVD